MKLKHILTLGLFGFTMTMMAQTHAEGVEYFKADQIENARTLLHRNLDKPGTDKAVAYYYLGQIAMLDGKPAEAAKYFELGEQANPEYAYNYVGLGQIALKNKEVKVADTQFKAAEKLGKKDASLQVAIARAYYDVDPALYAKEIEKRLQKARKIDIENPDIYIYEGDVLSDAKDWGGAGAKYEMAVNYDANTPAAYVKYANLFRQVNPQYSINMLNKLLQANPNSALGQRQLANAYYDQGNYAEAAKQYGRYVNNPNHFKEDEDRYAFLLFYDNKYQQGYDYATKLLSQNPDNFSALRYQFMNAAQIKDMQDKLLLLAEKLYKTHLANPSANKFAPIDYILIADEFQRAGRPDEAIAVLQEATLDMPENANFSKQLASIYVDKNDLAAATEAFAKYIEKTKKPDYNDYIQQAIYAYFAGRQNIQSNPTASQNYFNIATANANKAAEAMPEMYKPVKVLGDIAIAQASKELMASVAEPYYSKAITMLEASKDPSRYKSDAKEMYNYMGNFYLDKKNVAKAKEYFNKYLQLDPDNAQYRKFVEGLK